MVVSMTGYASTNTVINIDERTKVNVSMSLKSLNSRFFEASCKLPYALSHMETTLIKLFKLQLGRGHIYFNVHMQESKLFKGSIEPSINLIEGYVHAIEKIKQQLPLSGSLTIEQILRIPDAFTMPQQEVDEAVEQQLLEVTQDLINKLIDAQKKEGIQLAADLQTRVARMQQEITEIEKESGRLIEQQKAKVQAAVEELTVSGSEDQIAEMRKNALYSMLDKMDIHEEIVRFTSHLKNFNDHLNSEIREKGKQLDFTLQELGREINTIAAKCSDASIGSRAITIKVELEKAREQVQNIV